jgi:hypothetical protein
MDRHELQATLSRLRDELRAGPPLDPTAREQLDALAHEIEQQLHPDRSEPEALEALESIAKNLRQAIERFEESHPALTAAVNHVADTLARMGI